MLKTFLKRISPFHSLYTYFSYGILQRQTEKRSRRAWVGILCSFVPILPLFSCGSHRACYSCSRQRGRPGCTDFLIIGRRGGGCCGLCLCTSWIWISRSINRFGGSVWIRSVAWRLAWRILVKMVSAASFGFRVIDRSIIPCRLVVRVAMISIVAYVAQKSME